MALDLTEYDAAVTRFALSGAARTRMLADQLDGKPWTVDLVAGTATFGGKVYAIDLLGTIAADRTFLWSWANPGAVNWTTVKDAAESLRARGSEPGWAVLTERKVAGGWVNATELGWVCGELLGERPVRFLDAGQATAVVAFPEIEIDLATMPTAYLPGVIMNAMELAGDRVKCIALFLDSLGFDVSSTATSVNAVRDTTSLRVDLDADGRITNIKGAL
ncbi:MAG: hypothetical protein QM831_43190 [Kofleriaceae bacterium]